MTDKEGGSYLEHARNSYTEVLDATKHQDDKIGRVLGALAFFSAGVLAFLSDRVLQTTYAIGPNLPLAAISLALFLIFAGLAALLFLLAMNTPLTMPGHSDMPTAHPQAPSHLFFLDIGRQGIDDWRALWGPMPGGTGALDRSIAKDYVEESRNIARRAVRKYERSRDASGLFVAAMPFFALTITLAVYSLAGRPMPATGAVDVVEWSLAVRLIVGAVLGAFTLVLVFADASRGAVGIDPIAVLTYPLFVAALPGADVRGGATEAVLFILVGVCGFVTARVLTRRFAGVGDRAPGVRGRVAQVLIFGAPVLAIIVAALGWPLWQLALAVVAMTVLPLTSPLQALLRFIPSPPARRS